MLLALFLIGCQLLLLFLPSALPFLITLWVFITLYQLSSMRREW